MNDMDVVILVAGASSRFKPFNKRGHKSMFKIMGKPILEHTIESVRKAGFGRIILVINPEDKLIKKYFGNKVEYCYQEKPLGMANAILSGKNKLKTKEFFVINAQSFAFHQYAEKLIKLKEKTKSDLVFLTQKTNQPEKYGIFRFKNNQVSGLEEKPKNWKGKAIRIVGSYYLNNEFLEFLEKEPVKEYQFEIAFDKYFKNKKIELLEIKNKLPSLKYASDLLKLKNRLISLKIKKQKISLKAEIKKTVIIEGPVLIEAGAKVYDFAIIQGPAYIGKNSVVGAYCQVRKSTILEEGVKIQRYGDVSNSLIGENTHLHSGFIGDSVIGENCRIGAGFITANRRFDRKETFGIIMGNNCQIGINVSTMPGKIIKNNSVIMPGTIVK